MRVNAPVPGPDRANRDGQAPKGDLVRVDFEAQQILPPGLPPTEDELRIVRTLLERDLGRLDTLLAQNRFDRRNQFGLELEYVVTDSEFRPLPIAPQLLERNAEFRSEQSQYNIETGADPVEFRDRPFDRLEAAIRASFAIAREEAASLGGLITLAGIYPGYREGDLRFDRLLNQYYRDLHAGMVAARGSEQFRLTLQGKDRLEVPFDSMVMQSLNTSVQFHESVSVDAFADEYNLTQLLSGPVLTVSGNSSLVFGRRVAAESRVFVWPQATDEEHVPFGDRWIRHPRELFQAAARVPVILVNRNYTERLQAGVLDETDLDLPALTFQNGKVWRWNRACYGVEDGVPHLRIENRIFAAGPTIQDMKAQAALLYGAKRGLKNRMLRDLGHTDISRVASFDDTKRNFYEAAQYGLDSVHIWFDDAWERELVDGKELTRRLLELAREGLAEMGYAQAEVESLLDPITGRLVNGQTGSEWLSRSFTALEGTARPEEITTAISRWMYYHQNADRFEGINLPVYRWPLATLEDPFAERSPLDD